MTDIQLFFRILQLHVREFALLISFLMTYECQNLRLFRDLYALRVTYYMHDGRWNVVNNLYPCKSNNFVYKIR